MANILTTNAKRQVLMLKDAEKSKKIDETRVNKVKAMAKRAQDLNKVLKEKQRTVAIDRKKHIKESLVAYEERIKRTRSAEKPVAETTSVVRVDKEYKERMEMMQTKMKAETQDVSNKLQSYFIDYAVMTENARNRRENNIYEQTKCIKKRLSHTTEVHTRAKQGINSYVDALSDQLIKKLLKNEENVKTAKIKRDKNIEEERKKLDETIVDKRKKVRLAEKNKQKDLEEQFANEQERVQKIDENIQKVREQKQMKLRDVNIKWKEYFLRALEINESNVR